MLPGAKDGDLLRFKCLFTTKLISLTVLSGKAQQIQFTVLIHLKLGKSLCRVLLTDYAAQTGLSP